MAQSAIISLIDPRKVRGISSGEIKVAATIDVKGRLVSGGLLCQRIFGPVKRGICACGKYHKGSTKKPPVCVKCGVALVDPIERRRRFGHIDLAAPVVHPWYRTTISVLLGIPPPRINSIIECREYLVLRTGEDPDIPFSLGDFVSAEEYLSFKSPRLGETKAETGGRLIKRLLEQLDLDSLMTSLQAKRPSRRVNKRLLLARDIKRSGTDPSRMVLENLLVLPPDLRPVVAFDDGSFASSDLNELYLKVIRRNNRLKDLYAQAAPETLIRNDLALLQNAVDSLIDNERTVKATRRGEQRPLRSLTATVGGKAGTLRRHVLGKRTDYSGRSVIVVGPSLKLTQCGIPLEMATNIFKPFVHGRLLGLSLATSLRHARVMVDHRTPAAIDALDYVLSESVILLNRAPTLHRMGLQAFEPVLVGGKALQLHPLVCSAFNADFDGDQMAVHVPATMEARVEARILMLSTNNLLSPATGKIAVDASQDIVLGIYWLTKEDDNDLKTGMLFADKGEVASALNAEIVKLHSRIKVRSGRSIIETTPGRIIFSEIFPDLIPFSSFNKTITKKDISMLVEECLSVCGRETATKIIDSIKELGFKYATNSGISFCLDDITMPTQKEAILSGAGEIIKRIEEGFRQGQITEEERHNQIVDTWQKVIEEISDSVMKHLESSEAKTGNSLFMMVDSGARGSREQLRQLAAMRGLMAKPTGEIVEIPIRANLKEGLTCHEYLLSCHGARKGRADGALRTSNAGYFSRKLVDAAHDIVIEQHDCGAFMGLEVSALMDNDMTIISLADRITGRVAAERILNPATGKVIVACGDLISREKATALSAMGFIRIRIRSPLYCELQQGICAACYGHDLSRKDFPDIGEAVGVIAAQSIGEPGTQLTLRTFHFGGSANVIAKDEKTRAVSGDITHGLEKVLRLLEIRETAGEIDPEDILKRSGPAETARFIIDEVQKVYGSQGVEINDKHLEIIVKKMLSKVRITEAGDTDFVIGEIVQKKVFLKENEGTNGRKAVAEQILVGLTNIALTAESWLSAASFQRTASVLADAALRKREDPLVGIKENIIVGNMVPVGTGHPHYRNTYLLDRAPKHKTNKKDQEKKEAYEKLQNLFKRE